MLGPHNMTCQPVEGVELLSLTGKQSMWVQSRGFCEIELCKAADIFEDIPKDLRLGLFLHLVGFTLQIYYTYGSKSSIRFRNLERSFIIVRMVTEWRKAYHR